MTGCLGSLSLVVARSKPLCQQGALDFSPWAESRGVRVTGDAGEPRNVVVSAVAGEAGDVEHAQAWHPKQVS